MSKDNFSLHEKNGLMLYRGLPVRRGDQIEIEGVIWSVLGSGRSTGRTQAPFLWVKSDRFGTSILAPALDAGPHRTPRPIENDLLPRRMQPAPNLVESATIADLSNADLSPAVLARFKKEISLSKPKHKIFMTAA